MNAAAPGEQPKKPRRRRLPDERNSLTHKFSVGGHEGYVTVGLFDDGMPGEVFITMAKEGSVISGLMDAFATSISICLQYGVPLDVLVNKFVHMRFEPSGYTNNPEIRVAKSLIDYLFRWMALKFLSRDAQLGIGVNVIEAAEAAVEASYHSEPAVRPARTYDNQSDAPACDICGSMMVRHASQYNCFTCGATADVT